MSGVFQRALAGTAQAVPPIWLMRQAGRYHAHYQRLRASHSFEALCRTPELAAEVAMGPVEDFDLDAAILFSDLLFPLDALGMGLSYDSGRPVVDGPLTFERVSQFRSLEQARSRLVFQRTAMAATRRQLSRDKGLIGFIGGPWTLFVYAVEGSHTGPLARARQSLDLYRAFADRLVPLLVANVRLQFEGGADVVMVLDTAAGVLPADVYRRVMCPDLAAIADAFPGRLGYYAKHFSTDHLDAVMGLGARGSTPAAAIPWAGVGLDMYRDLATALASRRAGFVQGNFDPEKLLLEEDALVGELDRFLEPIRALDEATRRGWICGLGHGVLPATPQENVRTFVKRVRETFS
jgi:uroporphyrinogen decarboxylase